MSETIDLTPSWVSIVPILVLLIQDGTPEARHAAIEELTQMAKAADRYNELVPLLNLTKVVNELEEATI